MERISKISGICLIALIFATQIPALIGTLIIDTSRPEEEIKIQSRIESNDVVAIFYPDGMLVIANSDGENYVSFIYKYSAIKVFHIGPFFDNHTGGRYRIIGTTIRPNASESYIIRIDRLDRTIINGEYLEVEDKMAGNESRLIINKDGTAKWSGQKWEKAEDSITTDILFHTFMGHYENVADTNIEE